LVDIHSGRSRGVDSDSALDKGIGRDGDGVLDGVDIGGNALGNKSGCNTSAGIYGDSGDIVYSGGRGLSDGNGSGGSSSNSGGLAIGGHGDGGWAVVLDANSRVKAVKSHGVVDVAVVRASLFCVVEGGSNTAGRKRTDVDTVGKSLGKAVGGLALGVDFGGDIKGRSNQELGAGNGKGDIDGRNQDLSVVRRA
jgi:hypothetical protein